MDSTTNAEELAYMGYQILFGLDPRECRQVDYDANKPHTLEIEVDGSRLDFDTFLIQAAAPVTVDFFSANFGKMIAERYSSMPKLMKMLLGRKKIDLQRLWSVIMHNKSAVGFVDYLKVSSGFPTIIDPEEYARFPQQTLEHAMDRVKNQSPLELFFSKTQEYSRMRVGLHKNFLATHEIYPINQEA